MVEILALVLHHDDDEQAVLTAMELALEAGVPTKTHVLNVLHRLLEGQPAPAAPVTASQALRLVNDRRPMCCATTSCVVLRPPTQPRRCATRHDPASGTIVIMLRKLKMYGMAQAVAELSAQGAPAFDAAQPILAQLLKAETAEREVRSVAYQLKVARFPVYRELARFHFAHSEVSEALVRQLHRCDSLEEANNVVLVGGPGTGKTHLATALGVQAIEHHHRWVRFFSTVELVNALELVKAQGSRDRSPPG